MNENPILPDKALSKESRKNLLRISEEDIKKAIKKSRRQVAELIKADIA